MKHLIIALICVFAGVSTYAAKTIPHEYTAVSLMAKTVDKSKEVSVSLKENKNVGLFRRQMRFTFTDLCGQTLTVWVSGPHSSSNYDLWNTALNYAHSEEAMYAGCFK